MWEIDFIIIFSYINWNVIFIDNLQTFHSHHKPILPPRLFLPNFHWPYSDQRFMSIAYHVKSFKYLHLNWISIHSLSLLLASLGCCLVRVIHAWKHTYPNRNRWVRMFGRKFVLELAFYVNIVVIVVIAAADAIWDVVT